MPVLQPKFKNDHMGFCLGNIYWAQSETWFAMVNPQLIRYILELPFISTQRPVSAKAVTQSDATSSAHTTPIGSDFFPFTASQGPWDLSENWTSNWNSDEMADTSTCTMRL